MSRTRYGRGWTWPWDLRDETGRGSRAAGLSPAPWRSMTALTRSLNTLPFVYVLLSRWSQVAETRDTSPAGRRLGLSVDQFSRPDSSGMSWPPPALPPSPPPSRRCRLNSQPLRTPPCARRTRSAGMATG
ncbi:hypothetical protein ACFFX0_27995 [Citricoccus parietis]|uniref:Uncharacterized protein n=1 Tax=Citricoccus parietis TaxID=592307 RepID=A0ABV5G896_9MICC